MNPTAYLILIVGAVFIAGVMVYIVLATRGGRG